MEYIQILQNLFFCVSTHMSMKLNDTHPNILLPFSLCKNHYLLHISLAKCFNEITFMSSCRKDCCFYEEDRVIRFHSQYERNRKTAITRFTPAIIQQAPESHRIVVDLRITFFIILLTIYNALCLFHRLFYYSVNEK